MTAAMTQKEMKAATKGVLALMEASSKPYKPLTSKVERYIEEKEIKALNDAQKEYTNNKSVFMTEPPKYGMTDKQREGAKVGKANLTQIRIGD